MSFVIKSIHAVNYLFKTIIMKARYRSNISMAGLIKKRFDTQIIIEKQGKLILGKGVSFQRNVSISTVGGLLEIGDNTSFNRNCIVISREKISIGSNVIFGPGVTIYDHDHRFSCKGIMPGYKHGSVIIENGCWIGANVTILRNTHIGEGCVIGASTVVKGNIPPHSLVTGERNMNVIPIIEKKA